MILGKLFYPFLKTKLMINASELSGLSVGALEPNNRGPYILIPSLSLETIPQSFHVGIGGLKSPCTAVLRHVWRKQHSPGPYICCDSSDSMSFSQAHSLLAGVIAAGQMHKQSCV